MAIIRGTVHDDVRSGTGGHDIFQFFQGGEDTLSGDDGNDIFKLGGALSSGDEIDGGTGVDRLYLNGDYSGGFTFGNDALVSVEHIRVGGDFDYALTTNDANVAKGKTLTVHAGGLGAGRALTFDGSAETKGHFVVFGSAGDDDLTGGAKADRFHLERGGADTAYGGGGNDVFVLAGADDVPLDDVVDGGTGRDTAVLDGNYVDRSRTDAHFLFTAAIMSNVETLKLTDHHYYFLDTQDDVVAAGKTLTVDASAMANPVFAEVFFDGSAETDGRFHFIAGQQINIFVGGEGNDVFDLTQGGGSDGPFGEELGGGGDDVFNVGAVLGNYENNLNGGTGNDTLTLEGDYSGGAGLAGVDVTNVETVKFLGAYTYNLTVYFDVAGGATLTLDGSAIDAGHQLILDLATPVVGASSSAYVITGGAGNDSFKLSGSGPNSVTGGGGADTVNCNTNTDTLVYTDASQSTSTNYDDVNNFDANADKFDFHVTVDGYDGNVSSSIGVNHATFDANVASQTAGHFGGAAGTVHAMLFSTGAEGGDLDGHLFLIVDVNGNKAYDAGTDYVVDMTGYSGTLDSTDFI